MLKIFLYVVLLLIIPSIFFVSVDAVSKSISLNDTISVSDNTISIVIDNSTAIIFQNQTDTLQPPINPLIRCKLHVDTSQINFGNMNRTDTTIEMTTTLDLIGRPSVSLSVTGSVWMDINGNNIMPAGTTQFWIYESISGATHTPLTPLTNGIIDVGTIVRKVPLVFSQNVTVSPLPSAASFAGVITQDITFELSGC